MAKVTVVIPCYNHGAFLADAVASVRAQTYVDWEIIIVDDGSTDPATRRIIEGFTAQKIKSLRNRERVGPGVSRNRGIELGTGQYILPLDADDKIGHEYLRDAVQVLESNSRVGIVYSLAEFFGTQSGEWQLPPFELPRSAWEPAIFNCALFRRDDWKAVGGYSASLNRAYEDHDLWLGILALGRSVHRLPKPHFFYRRVPNSLAQSIDFEGKVAAYMTMIERHREFMTAQLEGLVRGFLAREAIAQVWHQRPVAQIFLPTRDGFNEEASARREYSAGDWRDIELRFPDAVEFLRNGAIRIDPGMQAGGFDLESLEWLTERGPTGRFHVASADFTVSGTALKLDATGFVRLLSFGTDPQCTLHNMSIPADATGLIVRLRFLPQIESLADSFDPAARNRGS
jgi:hypothetical protein